MWNILQNCDKSNNDITTPIIDLVTKIYHNLSTSLDDRIHDIEDEFINECLSRLKAVTLDNANEYTDLEKKQMCYITMHLLFSFINDSEKNGSAMIRSHSSLEKGEFLESIIIQNNITS